MRRKKELQPGLSLHGGYTGKQDSKIGDFDKFAGGFDKITDRNKSHFT